MFFLWFFGVGVVDVLRPASRFVFRFVQSLVTPFVSFSPFRSSPRFSPSLSFRFSVWACRGSVRGSRRFCQLVLGGLMFFLFHFSVLWRRWWVCIVDGGGSVDVGVWCLCGACGSCRLARRCAGRDDRSPVRWRSPCRSLAYARSLSRIGWRAVSSRRLMRRFCQLVLVCCQAMMAVCWRVEVMLSVCRFFSSFVSGWRGDGVSSRLSSRCGVPFVLASCFSSRLSSRVGVSFVFRGLASRVGVSFVVSALASRLSSCVGVLLLVSCRRSVLSGVSCRCCPVAPFLSARVPVSSRLFSPLLLFSVCSSRRACRMASGRCGVAVGRFVVAVGRAIWVLRGDMRCEAAWRRAVR